MSSTAHSTPIAPTPQKRRGSFRIAGSSTKRITGSSTKRITNGDAGENGEEGIKGMYKL